MLCLLENWWAWPRERTLISYLTSKGQLRPAPPPTHPMAIEYLYMYNSIKSKRWLYMYLNDDYWKKSAYSNHVNYIQPLCNTTKQAQFTQLWIQKALVLPSKLTTYVSRDFQHTRMEHWLRSHQFPRRVTILWSLLRSHNHQIVWLVWDRPCRGPYTCLHPWHIRMLPVINLR